MPPSLDHFPLRLNIFPLQRTGFLGFQQRLKVEAKEVAKTVVLSVASSHHVHFASNCAGGVESPGAGFRVRNSGFLPRKISDVVDPEVAEVVCAFPSKNNQKGVFKLRHMVGPFPGGRLGLEGGYFDPVHGGEVEGADCVVALLVGASASEEQELVIDGIVVEGGVGPFVGDVTLGEQLLPL